MLVVELSEASLRNIEGTVAAAAGDADVRAWFAIAETQENGRPPPLAEPGAFLALVELLGSLPELGGETPLFVRGPNTINPLQPYNLALWLLDWSMAAGAHQATKDLDTFLRGSTVDCMEVWLLEGIELLSVAKLSEQYTLYPIESFPAQLFRRQYRAWQEVRGTPFRFPFIPWHSFMSIEFRPTAALVRQCVMKGNLFATNVEAMNAPWEGIDPLPRCDALTFLPLIGPSAPVSIAHWLQECDHVPIAGYGGSSAGIGERREFGRAGCTTPSIEQLERAPDLLRCYQGLEDKHRRQIDIALQRLARALQKVESVDRALDLGIALESLLLSDQSSSDSIALPFRLRAAHLLGEDPESRLEVLGIFQGLYELRCQAAHSGFVKQDISVNGQKMPSEQLLSWGIEFCREIAERLVRLGRPPNWKSVLMGGPI